MSWMLVALALFLAPHAVQDGGGAPRRRVMTTFYPTTYFASRLAAGDADVECPLPVDEDPAFWSPARDVVLRYQAADLIVVNGAAFEKWVERANLPFSKIVDTCRGFKSEWITIEHAVTHSHGKEGMHSHEGIDGHTWLDPDNARRQAEAIAGALERLLPERAAVIAERMKALAADLDDLHARYAALGTLPPGERLYASHPAYNYLARRFSWPVATLALDPDEMPEDAVLDALAARVRKEPGRFLLWESAPRPEIEARVQERCGLKSLVVAPCENLGADARARGEDFLSVQRGNVDALRPAFLGAKR